MDRSTVNFKLFLWNTIFLVFFVVSVYISFVYLGSNNSTISKWIGLNAGAVALLLASCKTCELSFLNKNEKSYVIFSDLAKFSFECLKKQLSVSLIFALVISAFIYFFLAETYFLTYMFGNIMAIISLIMANYISVKVLAKVTTLEKESKSFIYKMSYCASEAMVLIFSGVAISTIVILYHIFKDFQYLFVFAFGYFSTALIVVISYVLSRNASKNTDETIAKFSNSFSYNDKRNPVALLITLSKSVFSVNKLSFNVMLTCLLPLCAAIGVGAMGPLSLRGAFLPIIIMSVALFSVVFTVFFVKADKNKNIVKNYIFSTFINMAIFLFVTYIVVKIYTDSLMGLYNAILLTSLVSFVLNLVYLNRNFIFKPVRNVVNSAMISYTAPIFQTFKEGFLGIFLPAFATLLVVVISFFLSYGIESPSLGLYGSALSCLVFCAMTLMLKKFEVFAEIINSYSMINFAFAQQLNQISENNFKKFKIDSIKIFGLSKTFECCSSLLIALSLIAAISVNSSVDEVNLLNPCTFLSIVAGAIFPLIFTGFLMNGTSALIIKLIFEIKARFKRLSQTNDINIEPDYMRCCEIASFKSSVFASIYVFVAFALILLISILFGFEGIIGFVFGLLISSFGLAFLINKTNFISRTALYSYVFAKQNVDATEEYVALLNNDNFFSGLSNVVLISLVLLLNFAAILSAAFIPIFSMVTMVK